MSIMLRRLALAVTGHARRMLPLQHALWGEGMENEVHHIPDDAAALRWALGCTLASYRVRLAPLADHAVRLFLIAVILFFCYENLVGPVQAIGCYVHISQPARDLLASLPDDRIICISWPAVPLSVQCLSLAAAILFAASALQLFLRRRALRLFAAASTAGLAAFVFEQGLPALAAYRYSALFGPVLEYVALRQAIMPALVATGLWLATWPRQESGKPAG